MVIAKLNIGVLQLIPEMMLQPTIINVKGRL